jgi:hypothetical protein
MLAHLCEWVFFFFQQCVNTSAFSIFIATDLLVRGLIPGASSPMYEPVEPSKGSRWWTFLRRRRRKMSSLRPHVMRKSPEIFLATSTVGY